jgi:hypothetical protein
MSEEDALALQAVGAGTPGQWHAGGAGGWARRAQAFEALLCLPPLCAERRGLPSRPPNPMQPPASLLPPEEPGDSGGGAAPAAAAAAADGGGGEAAAAAAEGGDQQGEQPQQKAAA